MIEVNENAVTLPVPSSDLLSDVLRQGAQRMLAAAVQAEVDDWLVARSHLVDASGRRQVVRNGFLPERTIITGLGEIEIKQPRVRDRRPENERETFSSSLLPPYLRRTKSVDELLPWLYLKGISTGDMPEALQAIVGPQCGNLSANTVVRLKQAWEAEHREWSKRSLANKEYVYVWADGVHSQIRLGEDDKQCLLVLIGATKEGKKELIAVYDGVRESEQSWTELLLDLKRRGLTIAPKLAIGDGALGFWAAVRKVWPTTEEQRCWVHKTANVLNSLPKSKQPSAKQMLHEIWMAETKEQATKSFEAFLESYDAKYPKAVEILRKDRDVLLAFYDFPAEHWRHIRTTNPIESTFATIRLRHRRTKGSGSAAASLAMMFKLAQSAEKKWRILNGHELIPDVIQGTIFKDGVKQVQVLAS
jgi:transposase-like protein